MVGITYKVHRVLDGPIESLDGEWYLTCKVEDVQANEIFHDDIPFVSFDAAYKFQSHFLHTIEPIIIDLPREEEFDA